MNKDKIINFRNQLRHFERELDIQNSSNCCCGVTLTQCHVLMELDEQDDLTLKELSERMYLDKSTVSRTVDGLVNQGLLSRKIPEQNRRTVAISLNDKGQSVCNTINKDNNEYFGEIFKELTEEEFDNFLSTFDKVVHKMIEINNTKKDKKDEFKTVF